MKKTKLLLGISLLGLLCSCEKADPAAFEPTGVDFSVYSENPYITENGTVYAERVSDRNYVCFRLSPRGVIFQESRLGKMLFEETPLYTYYIDSETSFHYDYKSGGGGYMMNGVWVATPETQNHVDGHFFINDDGVRCLTLSAYKGTVFIAE
ncbi:MAG TPA: hypothetical protein DCO86_02950 [Spirochaetaceae bacterium]|nr:hypothetical protein [Spirochaetaceae bacterium]